MKQSATAHATIIVLVGPAGAGKSATCDKLLELRPDFVRLKTVTTRPMRDEKDLETYIPETVEGFARRRFIESLPVHGTSLYGTPERETLEAIAQGGVFLLCIDIRGFEKIREYFEMSDSVRVFGIFIDVPDEGWEDRLRARMASRPGSSPADIDRRIETARSERSRRSACDIVIPNHEGKLDETASKVLRFIESLSVDR